MVRIDDDDLVEGTPWLFVLAQREGYVATSGLFLQYSCLSGCLNALTCSL